MIGNICPEDLRKYQVTFENIPMALEADGAFVEGLQGIELTSRPSDYVPAPMSLTVTETVAGSRELEHIARWLDLARAQKTEKPYTIYATKRGAIVEYSWPCFKLQFRSLRLARVFAKTYKVEWQIETKEAAPE